MSEEQQNKTNGDDFRPNRENAEQAAVLILSRARSSFRLYGTSERHSNQTPIFTRLLRRGIRLQRPR